jgi:hypothetical protein
MKKNSNIALLFQMHKAKKIGFSVQSVVEEQTTVLHEAASSPPSPPPPPPPPVYYLNYSRCVIL